MEYTHREIIVGVDIVLLGIMSIISTNKGSPRMFFISLILILLISGIIVERIEKE